MDDWQVLAIVAAWIIGIVILIVRFKVNPIIALVVGALGMGLSLGLGVEGTTEAVMTGFGEVMLEIGLLIGWGVIMGSMLYQMGAIQRLVAVIIKLFGRKTPYGLGLAMGVALQSIHIDVLLVMTAPLAKAIGKRMGRNGVGKIAVAMAIGLECGIVLMVPGVATVALSGLMGVPLGQMLIFGTIVLIPTLLISIFLMCWLFDHGFWNPAKDESQAGAEEPEGMAMMAPDSGQDAAALELLGTDAFAAETGQTATVVRTETAVEPQHAEAAASAARSVKQTPLLVMFAPLIGSLLLVALGAGMKLADLEHPVVTFFASPVVALLVGVIFTSIVCARTLGAATSGKALEEGLRQAGNIMLLNGAGGCLGAVVATGGLGALLSGYFSTNLVLPLVTVWVIAAVLHIAVGSVSISAMTAAGILAPVIPVLGINPVLVALAAGAGSLFLIHVTSNTFWMLQSMLGQSPRGAFKTVSVGVSLASVVALGMVLILSVFI